MNGITPCIERNYHKANQEFITNSAVLIAG